MAEDLWITLLRFHREIVIPDVYAILETIREDLTDFRRETNANIDRREDASITAKARTTP
ncbi:MAG TPA: hypothetical protein VL284_17590 [Thermoanaerobaculia bacterium]|nr:hypothetical protein [Thermoanaerobaculia bacterium]